MPGGCKAEFPEFTLLINCSIVTDHYLFQRLTDKRASIGIENLQPAREYLESSVYLKANHGPWLGPGEIFQIEALIWLENATFGSGFCKEQRHFTYLLSRIYRNCV